MVVNEEHAEYNTVKMGGTAGGISGIFVDGYMNGAAANFLADSRVCNDFRTQCLFMQFPSLSAHA